MIFFYTFAKNNNKQAFKWYTMALLNAPICTESLLLAYSNRSAVFFDESLYKNCLQDINSTKYILNAIINNKKEEVDKNG